MVPEWVPVDVNLEPGGELGVRDEHVGLDRLRARAGQVFRLAQDGEGWLLCSPRILDDISAARMPTDEDRNLRPGIFLDSHSTDRSGRNRSLNFLNRLGKSPVIHPELIDEIRNPDQCMRMQRDGDSCYWLSWCLYCFHNPDNKTEELRGAAVDALLWPYHKPHPLRSEWVEGQEGQEGCDRRIPYPLAIMCLLSGV